MIKRTILAFATVLFTFSAMAQQSNRTLLTVADEEVSVDDFLSIYNKNRSIGDQIDPKSLDEYLDLFINFKLKVKDAEALGMDTIPSFIKELAGYRTQLAKPYLVDKEAGEDLIKEAYDRLQYEVRASHILIQAAENASPADTLKAYRKISNLRKEILAGADFATLAKQNSEDPSAAENAGDLGYFSALYMVYPFENAAYSTAVGEVSEIIRTRFGYHIMNVVDKRVSRGEVQTAHIMVMFPNKAGENSAEEIAKAKLKVDEIYQKVVAEGADFAEMAKQYSDDKNNANKGGELPWFGTNRMVESFEDAAFTLENSGDISAPVETPFGWHIIKLLDKKGLTSYEEMKADLTKRVEKDARSQRKRNSLINKLKESYNFKEYAAAKKQMESVLTDEFFAMEWTVEEDAKHLTKTLFVLNGEKYGQQDFAKYLSRSAKRLKKEEHPSVVINSVYSKWVDDQVIAYEDSRLEEKYNDFRLLMQEYRDGILLYELTDDKVWNKAVKDTTGLQEFYELNKNNYMWDARVDAHVFNCATEKIAKKVRKKVLRGCRDFEKIQAKMNKKSPLNLDIKEGRFLSGDNATVDQVSWTEPVSELIYDNDNVKFVFIAKQIEPQVKLLSEAKGKITSDYQDYLEKEWISNLRAKITVEINDYVLELAKTGNLAELDIVEVPEVPVLKGHFEKAYAQAVELLGASKDRVFDWYGNLFTTEFELILAQ
jgi:peptidyl-prolyl cis-trans isomerase SurA